MAPRSDGKSGPPGDVPELELPVRAGAAPTTTTAKTIGPESPLELAVDPRALVQQRSAIALSRPTSEAAVVGPNDLAFDARLLAEYGDPPGRLLLAPLYAYRVWRRRRELKTGLAGRREEAARAADAVEDALVAFADRVRSTAETAPAYSHALDALRSAEDLLRSRDRVLAEEQDAQNARLSQVDSRLAKLEAEATQAHDAERALAADLSETQSALGREEARLKRAEIELRAMVQREGADKAGE